MKWIHRICLIFPAVLLTACVPTLSTREYADTTQTDTTPERAPSSSTAKPMLLSAFFGLDNALPKNSSRGLCDGSDGQDGMPVIFSSELERASLQAGDFKVQTKSGKLGSLVCVTFAPAIDVGELRTVLLVGEYGSRTDPPLSLEIVGNVYSLDQTQNFKGAKIKVTPLEAGPSLVLAEVKPENQWKPEVGKKGGPFGVGSDCPSNTKQVLRVTWAGGILKPNRKEIDDLERSQYKVKLEQPDQSITEVVPFAIGDLDDGDNNHDLCLEEVGQPLEVSFPAGFVVDPANDLNPATSIKVGNSR